MVLLYEVRDARPLYRLGRGGKERESRIRTVTTTNGVYVTRMEGRPGRRWRSTAPRDREPLHGRQWNVLARRIGPWRVRLPRWTSARTSSALPSMIAIWPASVIARRASARIPPSRTAPSALMATRARKPTPARPEPASVRTRWCARATSATNLARVIRWQDSALVLPLLPAPCEDGNSSTGPDACDGQGSRRTSRRWRSTPACFRPLRRQRT